MSKQKAAVGYTVDGMSHAEMLAMVNRRLNKLAMCKRGVLETSKNEALGRHGQEPYYTKDEKAAIESSLEKRIVKALTPTVSMLRKSRSLHSLADTLSNKASKIRQEAFEHPGIEKWKAERKLIAQQYEQRMGVLDADFQEAVDNFGLGIWPITYLVEKLTELEQSEW